jgi:hypothetical protein
MPFATSLGIARRFWAASGRARVLNSRLFRNDVELGAAVIAMDRAWPLAWDVDLVLPAELGADRAEEKRRAAAFVLSPRRVFVGRGALDGKPFVLTPRRTP